MTGLATELQLTTSDMGEVEEYASIAASHGPRGPHRSKPTMDVHTYLNPNTHSMPGLESHHIRVDLAIGQRFQIGHGAASSSPARAGTQPLLLLLYLGTSTPAAG